jgi:phosphohistidine phosphatase SixA
VNLLIIRHGPAGNREEWEAEGRDDRLRPLTPKGKKEVRKAAGGLRQLVPALDLLATSPWTRAAETAQLVATEYGCEIVELEARKRVARAGRPRAAPGFVGRISAQRQNRLLHRAEKGRRLPFGNGGSV